MSAPRAHRQLGFHGTRSQLEARAGVCFDLVVSSEPASTRALRLLVSVTAVSATQIGKVRTILISGACSVSLATASEVREQAPSPALRARPATARRRSPEREPERPRVAGSHREPEQLALAHAVRGGRGADRLVNDPAVTLEGGGDQWADLLGLESPGPAEARRWSSPECRPRSSATTRAISPVAGEVEKRRQCPWVVGNRLPKKGRSASWISVGAATASASRLLGGTIAVAPLDTTGRLPELVAGVTVLDRA